MRSALTLAYNTIVGKEYIMKKEESCSRLNRVGGQAVLEGIMMKSSDNCCTACRLENGEIGVHERKFVSVRKKHKFLNIPILRGIVNFIEMLILSYSTLTISAEMMGISEEEQETKAEKWLKKHFGIKLFDILMVIALVLGVALCLGLFIYLPTIAVSGIAHLFGVEELGTWRAVPEGFIKIGIFVLYIYLVSLMPDIRRTFEYHGAEHKCIACFEAGEEMTPQNAKKYTRFHPRCGTSFLFVMLFIGIIISLLIPTSLNDVLRSVIKLLLMPVIVGLGYEFIMYAGKHPNLISKILSAPGLWMQRLTTREPDEKQLEVAIVAMKCAMPEDFPDFDRSLYIKNEKNKDGENQTE